MQQRWLLIRTLCFSLLSQLRLCFMHINMMRQQKLQLLMTVCRVRCSLAIQDTAKDGNRQMVNTAVLDKVCQASGLIGMRLSVACN
jgi:hypothetical protein